MDSVNLSFLSLRHSRGFKIIAFAIIYQAMDLIYDAMDQVPT